MSDPRSEELIYAESLIDNAKSDEALAIITDFEKSRELTSKEQLWTLLLKGAIYAQKQQTKKAIEIGDQAYKMSNEFGMILEKIESLFLKAQIVYQGRLDVALDSILEAENLFKSLKDKSFHRLSRLHLSILCQKAWVYYYIDLDTSLEFAFQSLDLAEKKEHKVFLGFILSLISLIFLGKSELDAALEYAEKVKLQMEDLEFQGGIAFSMWVMGFVHLRRGDLINALKFCSKGLSIWEASDFTKSFLYAITGGIYIDIGELNLALDNFTRALALAKESANYTSLLGSVNGLGNIYRLKNDFEQAIMYFKHSVTLSQEIDLLEREVYPQLYLFLLNLEVNSNRLAQVHLERLKELKNKVLTPYFSHNYLFAKAMMLKKKGLSRNRAEAERILKQLTNEKNINSDIQILAMVALCEFQLEELQEFNEPETLNELSVLISQLIHLGENQNSFRWITEGKLLQAKLALIQADLDKAKILLTQAQRIAEDHGLTLLAQKISSEHDTLLEKIDEWDKLKKKNVLIGERVDLASFDGVINRLQGKQAVKPPELVEEEPILLLIMDNSGATYFNHPFVANWDHSDLFSSFMSAFNTFIDELFSNSVDRIKVKENTILIKPVEDFLVCYVVKGQSYPALQKLSRFGVAIRESSEIWQALNNSVKTSEMLELNNPPELKTVITEIFE
ncbi:MAG: tetratricopeptide repeat protein [Candidatus Hodarchaeales archaeon]|jgi:tetratricopeptide (TPR) repeat protein